jgi:acetolactate synthase-like protein
MQSGGALIASALSHYKVPFLFTLCGGHISPILVECEKKGIRIIDVRDEATAVFAADAVARLSGVLGVAAVTAGPGLTNTITALKNAQMAQSPILLLGGATATLLKNKGALQDIDQMTLIRPLVKWAHSVSSLKDLRQSLISAFQIAQSGIPGPVFLECPVDLLYPPALVKEWYWKESGVEKSKHWTTRFVKSYLNFHLARQFREGASSSFPALTFPQQRVLPFQLQETVAFLKKAQRPVLILGSQALLETQHAQALAQAIQKLQIPTYLGGMSRGLLGSNSTFQFFHKRAEALKSADLVLVAGFPFDFRLGYGRSISGRAKVVAINRSPEELRKNRKPSLGICADSSLFLRELAQHFTPPSPPSAWQEWFETLKSNESARNNDIETQAKEACEYVHPLVACQALEKAMDQDSVIIVDGGDFVASASYILRPRTPLSWLDPGVFGTLGVGAGFALGAALCRPHSEIWLIYGDGSAGYTLSEFDTFVRHQIPVIALIGNDACWTQIAREQVSTLHSEVGTLLRRTPYHQVAEGFGAKGFLVEAPEALPEVLQKAKQVAREERRPVLINVLIGKTQFRKGSISL